MTEETETKVELTAKKNKPKMRLSASRMATWMTCPLQAKFQYTDKLPRQQNAAATFGTCIHKALEEYNNSLGNLDLALRVFKQWWGNPERYGIEPEVWPKYAKTFGGYMAAGVEALKSYDAQQKWTKRQLIGTEISFLVPFGDYELTGVIDLAEFTKNRKGEEVLRITDYKTNARKPFVTALKTNIQFTVYAYASEQKEFWTGSGPDFPGIPNGEWWYEMYKDYPRDNVWFGVMQGKGWDAGRRGEDDYMRLYRVAKEIEKAIDHNVYVPNISGDSCGICSYRGPCRLPFDPDTYDESDDL